MLPPYVADMPTLIVAVTVFEAAVKVPVVAPAAITIDAGTVAAVVLPLARLTVAPPAGAGGAQRDRPGARAAARHGSRVQVDGRDPSVHGQHSRFRRAGQLSPRL